MANKLKVEELRTELSKRGLSIKGTKATLVQRLESVLEEESKSTDGSVGKKREREAEAMVDGSASKKIKSIEDLQEMGIRELREQAILRGFSASGSKKKLLERLCAETGEKEENDEKEEEEEEEPVILKEKVSAKTDGTAELDQYLPDDIKTQYHVFEQDGEFYDAMLNQTNVGDNNNKFYAIQVLESNGGGKKFMAYSRWGRVGSKGQDKLQGPYASKEAAVKDFCTKFFSKTKNQWTERRDFVSYPKCYTWLEMDYSKDQESKVEGKRVCTIENQLQLQSAKLDLRIAKFIGLICNTSMMDQQMMVLGFNPSKLPLGKLSKATILKGYGVLKKISDEIDKNDKKTLEELSSEFYTVIPHDFGFSKMREWIIDTPLKLKSKLELVEALGEIELANAITKDDMYNKDDPLLSHYQCLRCELTPLEDDSAEFALIKTYIKNTGLTCNVDITQLFRASREGEEERFKKFSQTKNRMLLWHGSGLTNWVGILSQGLRIAPPEAPSHGYAFGKGIYFADMFSKSVDYSYNSVTRDRVLVLCEVALGEINELLQCNCHADELLNGKLSTKGVGRTFPDPAEACVLEDGVIVPNGNPLTIEDQPCARWQNEYIVYNVDQVRIRYVVHVNFRQH